jgi:hypothetical protein
MTSPVQQGSGIFMVLAVATKHDIYDKSYNFQMVIGESIWFCSGSKHLRKAKRRVSTKISVDILSISSK